MIVDILDFLSNEHESSKLNETIIKASGIFEMHEPNDKYKCLTFHRISNNEMNNLFSLLKIEPYVAINSTSKYQFESSKVGILNEIKRSLIGKSVKFDGTVFVEFKKHKGRIYAYLRFMFVKSIIFMNPLRLRYGYIPEYSDTDKSIIEFIPILSLPK